MNNELGKLIAEVDKMVAEMTMKEVFSALNKIGYSTFEFKWTKYGQLKNWAEYEKFLEKNAPKIIDSFKDRGISLNGEIDSNISYMLVGNGLLNVFSFDVYETKEDMDSEVKAFLWRMIVEMQSKFYCGKGEDVLSKIK